MGAPNRALGDAGEAGYRETIAQAVEEYRLQHWAEAIALFQRAHATRPSARTHRGLGMSYFEARDYGNARSHLEAAARDTRRPLTRAQHEHVETLLRRISAMVGEVHVRGVPAGAVLRIDGQGRAWDAGALVLLAGDHTIELELPGQPPLVRNVEVQAGARIELELLASPGQRDITVHVAPAAVTGQGAPPLATSAEAVGTREGPGPWPWILVTVSAASLVAGGVLVALAQADIAEVEAAPRGSSYDDYKDTNEGIGGTSAAGFALAGAGAVGLTAGLLWALDGGDGEAPAVQLGAGGPGVQLGGHF